MLIEDKYLKNNIDGYKLTHPEICQSCGYSTRGKRGFGQLVCKAYDNAEVDNYGTCPRWKKVYG